VAVIVTGYRPPPLSADRVPAIVPVPFPLSVKVRPSGNGPGSAKAGTGYPAARMVTRSPPPTMVLTVRIFWMAGARVTVRVNAWVAVPFSFLAVRVSGYTPAAAFLGIPEIVAVPSLSSVNFTPEGSAPVLVIVGVGSPVVVTVKVNAAPKRADRLGQVQAAMVA